MQYWRSTTAALSFFLAVASSPARAQIVERLDVSSPGFFGDVAADRVVISDDGQITAFLSRASNLVLPDDTVSTDVFVRNRATFTTDRIATNVAQTDRLEISGDGRWVTYAVAHPGAPQPFHHAFVHDRQQNTTTQVASSLLDALPGAITPDGHYLVIYGRSPALPGVPFQAYRLDLQTGVLLLASRDLQGMPARATPERGGISADGESLVFTSLAPNLVVGDTNGDNDVFLFRASTATVEQISVDDLGVGGTQESIRPSVSGDGGLVAFTSKATNLDPTDTNNFFDVYLRDVAQGTTRRLSFTATGGALNSSAENPLISANGRYVAFESAASNLIAGDGVLTTDIFVRDLSSEVTRAATPGSATAGQDSRLNSVSGDGRWITLRSTILSLPNAGPTGGAYLADFGPGCSSQGYCTALPNSTGAFAVIGSAGEASRLLNNMTLSVYNLPTNAIAIFVSGTAPVDPGVPFGNGLRCVGGTLTRHRVLHATQGVVIDFQDLTAPIYAGVNPGDVRYFQCVYRDPAAGGAAFNTSDALAVTFCF